MVQNYGQGSSTARGTDMGVILTYLKPTNYCNVGCSHCYLPEDTRAERDVMSWETLKQSAEMLRDLKERQNAPFVHVLYHGGEPLMLKPDWYRQASKVLDEYLGPVNEGHIESIQTSLIPYTSKFADVVHDRFGSFIGSSIDFSSRTVKGSAEAYLELWMKKVENARSDGIYVVPGMVPTKNEMGRGAEIIQWMLDRGFTEMNIDRYNAFGLKFMDRPSNKEHSKFLDELFDDVMARLRRGEKAPVINVTQAVIGGVLWQAPGDRWGGTCMSDFVVIEPDGSTNNCPDKASFEDPFSNVVDGIDAFRKSKSRKKWIRIQTVDHKTHDCSSCVNNSWCQSGCPITGNGSRDNEDECSGYWNHINHVREVLKNEDDMNLAIAYVNQQRELAS